MQRRIALLFWALLLLSSSLQASFYIESDQISVTIAHQKREEAGQWGFKMTHLIGSSSLEFFDITYALDLNSITSIPLTVGNCIEDEHFRPLFDVGLTNKTLLFPPNGKLQNRVGSLFNKGAKSFVFTPLISKELSLSLFFIEINQATLNGSLATLPLPSGELTATLSVVQQQRTKLDTYKLSHFNQTLTKALLATFDFNHNHMRVTFRPFFDQWLGFDLAYRVIGHFVYNDFYLNFIKSESGRALGHISKAEGVTSAKAMTKEFLSLTYKRELFSLGSSITNERFRKRPYPSESERRALTLSLEGLFKCSFITLNGEYSHTFSQDRFTNKKEVDKIYFSVTTAFKGATLMWDLNYSFFSSYSTHLSLIYSVKEVECKLNVSYTAKKLTLKVSTIKKIDKVVVRVFFTSFKEFGVKIELLPSSQ